MAQIGFVGLGRMGGNMVTRIRRDSIHDVVAFDFDEKAVKRATKVGATGVSSLRELVRKLEPPRMVGGPNKAVKRLAPILDVLAPPATSEHGPGWGHFGPTGAGHYVKMVHNGVEYGLMQAYAEGFDIFDKCEYDVDNAKVAHLWMQ